MKAFRKQGSSDTPEIIFDPYNDYFEINGSSLMSNAIDFYAPLLEWLKEYSRYPNDEVVVEVIMGYFNTSSSKLLLDVFHAFEEIVENKKDGHSYKVVIRWHHEISDVEMKSAGKDYEAMLELPFEFKSYTK